MQVLNNRNNHFSQRFGVRVRLIGVRLIPVLFTVNIGTCGTLGTVRFMEGFRLTHD